MSEVDEEGLKPTKPKQHIDEMIETAMEISVAKGWRAIVGSTDPKHRFATISVEKSYSFNKKVEGVIELTCNKKVSIRLLKTSFYDEGLSSLRDDILDEIVKLSWVTPAPKEEKKDIVLGISPVDIAEGVLKRFHRSVRQFRHRYADRPGFSIKDEYDVQDYLHAILRAFFDDVRAEEYTPSYAGGSSRIDFLLKSESIAIEVKFASENLRDKKIGEQLLIDVQRYQSHQGCKTLLCLVYDPTGDVRNPTGLENDLSKKYDQIDVKVIVVSPS